MEKTEGKKRNIILCVCVFLIFVFQTLVSKFSGYISGKFDYTILDQDNVFLFITVHHLIQMAITLMAITIISKRHGVSFYLKPIIDRKGMLYTIIFTICILIYTLITYIVGYSMNMIEPYSYTLNIKNVLGTLGFQLFMSGTSEEILFRALPIGILMSIYSKDVKHKEGIVVLIAAVLFSVAHIKWGVNPFYISFSTFQLIYAFILGLIYGFTYLKSKSVVYPVIMHGLSNFIMIGIGYIFQFIH